MVSPTDSANVVAPDGVPLRVDGPCLQDTLAHLETDGAARAALDAVRAQAIGLMELVVGTYELEVAKGEVGATGSGRTSSTAPECPTGLMYGRIQSGKTLAMIIVAALALDNGFGVVVVLTSDNVKLVEQTAARFAALEGPRVSSSTQADRWDADAAHVKSVLSDTGLVVVCSKNQAQLTKLVKFLSDVSAGDYPALILDDEADQATLDTTTNARAAGKPNAPKQKSTINRKTVGNDASDEVGDSIREQLRHNMFLQVTATPYALLLQNTDSPLKPDFTKLLEPGRGYTGGEHFFSREHIEQARPPVMWVAEDESEALAAGADVAPIGLVRAISFFLVAAGAQMVLDPKARYRAQNFLCHTSQKQDDHRQLSNLVRDHIARVTAARADGGVSGSVGIEVERAYGQLRETLPEAPPLEEITKAFMWRLPRREVVVVNSTGSNADFGSTLNFIVGGNILGRGLTIENLLVTYYLRRAKVSQMDTMLQHARMFGYREKLMPFTRVFLPETLAYRFHWIHQAEQRLRALLSDPKRKVMVQVGDGLKPTRLSVLDMGNVDAYTPGQHIYPMAPKTSAGAERAHEAAQKAVERVLGGPFTEHKQDDLVEISMADLLFLVKALPYEKPDEGSWDPAALESLLAPLATKFGDKAYLYARKMTRTKFAQGALEGPVLKQLRTKGRPVLCVFRDDGRKYEPPGRSGKPYEGIYWYPSLVLPDDDMPAHVFNTAS